MQRLNRIDALEFVKENLNNKTYHSGDNLKKELDDIIDFFWFKDQPIKNEDLFNINLKDFSIFHEYLIEKVIEIHKDENCSENAEILKRSTCFNSSLKETNDARSAHKIYMFNQPADYVFVGDLHSDDQSLKRALQSTKFYEKVVNNQSIRLVFIGDYVDRGHVHLKLMERVLILKYLFPEYIFLLRGNHDGGILNDDGTLTLPYRIPEKHSQEMYFPTYLKTLSSKNESFNAILLEQYLDFFNSLSYIAAIKIRHKTVLAVHGGIPRPKHDKAEIYHHLNVLADLTDESKVDHIGENICQNIMWSDPYRGDGDLREHSRRFRFTEEHFDEFRKKFEIDLLIRGHESASDGFRYHFNDRVITVFTSGSKHESTDQSNNKEIINTESWYVDISPKVLSISYDGTITFL